MKIKTLLVAILTSFVLVATGCRSTGTTITSETIPYTPPEQTSSTNSIPLEQARTTTAPIDNMECDIARDDLAQAKQNLDKHMSRVGLNVFVPLAHQYDANKIRVEIEEIQTRVDMNCK